MRKTFLFAVLFTVFAVTAVGASTDAQRAMVEEYCVTCHNQTMKTGGLMLDKMDLDHVAEGAETWEKVVKKLRGGMMPPLGNPRPEKADVDKLVACAAHYAETGAGAPPRARCGPTPGVIG